jgi:hypothetical protein
MSDQADWTVEDWLRARPAVNNHDPSGYGVVTDAPFEARRSAAVYGSSAAVLACNYGVSAEECRRLMNEGFEAELERRRKQEIEFIA